MGTVILIVSPIETVAETENCLALEALFGHPIPSGVNVYLTVLSELGVLTSISKVNPDIFGTADAWGLSITLVD